MKKKAYMRCVSIILIILLLSSNVMAANTTTEDYDTSLENAELLSTDEVLLIAEKQIEGYISTEIDLTTRTITASDDFIDLHDLDGNVFAYIVPLVETNVGEIGYIVVGALRDGFATYLLNTNGREELMMLRKMLSGKVTLTAQSDDGEGEVVIGSQSAQCH